MCLQLRASRPRPITRLASLGVLLLMSLALSPGASRAAVPPPDDFDLPGTAKVHDALQLVHPLQVKLNAGGLLGERFEANWKNRLLRVDEDELLAGFRIRPGKQAWVGEHVGKFLHAASLAYANTANPDLGAKLDRVVRGLLATQEADGYLGTYVPAQRFGLERGADWDVWVHKYCMIGLLAYARYGGDAELRAESLASCRRVADLLIATFGPGRRNIVTAGTHVGMAATSVLEPVVLLYRATADARFLDFANHLVESGEAEGGPKIVSTLLREKSVLKTANAKAYEMLSNLCGLCELYRATGEARLLDAVRIAWEDIVANRLYLTGTGSSHEHWQADRHLPCGVGDDMGETCVTVSWLQLNLQLLRLLGDARFGDEMERTIYNHLLGAQKPTGEAWCYYTPLEGEKPFGSSTNCCLSSGPRAVAMLPQMVFLLGDRRVDVNLFTPCEASLPPIHGTMLEVKVEVETAYPLDGHIRLTARPSTGVGWPGIRFRRPAFAGGSAEFVPAPSASSAGVIDYTFELPFSSRSYLERTPMAARRALGVGPLILAADSAHNPDLPPPSRFGLYAHDRLERDQDGGDLHDFVNESGMERDQPEAAWRAAGFVVRPDGARDFAVLRLVPFYMAGADGGRVQTWLRRSDVPDPAPARPGSLFSLADEYRSRAGNVGGSIADGDPATFVVTFNDERRDEDWFALDLGERVWIARARFAHGRSFHDGGWFETTRGKPRFEVRRTREGPWETVATFDDYPDAEPDKDPGLADGQAFEVLFPEVEVHAIRVVGRPACGDTPDQNFASCADLEAFER